MSRRRKNPVRDKVMGKKWIYLERNHCTDRAISEGRSSPGTILPRQECRPLQKASVTMKCAVGGFYELCSFIGRRVGGVFKLFWGEGAEIPRTWAPARILTLNGWPQSSGGAGGHAR